MPVALPVVQCWILWIWLRYLLSPQYQKLVLVRLDKRQKIKVLPLEHGSKLTLGTGYQFPSVDATEIQQNPANLS